MEFTKDRIQHYSNDVRECRDCGHRYFPKVHSQPYVVQFGAIILGIGLYVVFKMQAPTWLYAGIPVIILPAMLVYFLKDRKQVSPKMTKVKYGQIIIECPECGGDKP